MRYDYVVTLKRNNEKFIDSISILLCLGSAMAFLTLQVKRQHFDVFFTLASLTILTGLVTGIIRQREKGRIVRYRTWLVVAGIFWIAMPHFQWACLLFFVLAFLEYQAKYPLEIGFSTNQIVVNSIFRRKFIWSEFTNIMLKDGLLTLDFKNNRVIQKQTVDDEDEFDADEDEFNAYCKKQLNH
ncbi:MAG TPA: hypothetical protein VKR32_12985 [Puia sp.]|nr:hypothetical protein [Puia sp.]